MFKFDFYLCNKIYRQINVKDFTVLMSGAYSGFLLCAAIAPNIVP